MSAERHSGDPNEPVPCPLLWASPPFWWMNETDRSNSIEFEARQAGGQGYRYHPSRDHDYER